MSKYKTNSKFNNEEREIYVNSWNLEGQLHNLLYWVKSADMTDPRTQGYIGVGNEDRAVKSKQECIEQNFGTNETLDVIVLSEGETRAMDYLEAWYRPDFGIGWNYLRGGGRGFGGGSSRFSIRQDNYNKYKNKDFYADYKKL